MTDSESDSPCPIRHNTRQRAPASQSGQSARRNTPDLYIRPDQTNAVISIRVRASPLDPGQKAVETIVCGLDGAFDGGEPE